MHHDPPLCPRTCYTPFYGRYILSGAKGELLLHAWYKHRLRDEYQCARATLLVLCCLASGHMPRTAKKSKARTDPKIVTEFASLAVCKSCVNGFQLAPLPTTYIIYALRDATLTPRARYLVRKYSEHSILKQDLATALGAAKIKYHKNASQKHLARASTGLKTFDLLGCLLLPRCHGIVKIAGSPPPSAGLWSDHLIKMNKDFEYIDSESGTPMNPFLINFNHPG